MNRQHFNWIEYGLQAAGFAVMGIVSGCALCRSPAIPDRYPLGAVERAHFHTMQTNGEAGDFILHQMDFVGDTAELNNDGRDHIQEIAARLQSTPFPVLVERT